ncbi:hypothetical protein ACVBEJ_14090 [Porticoccus sp. GXU_MW_L64]
MKVKEMSRRTQEEHAAYLLKFSSSLFLAFIITVTIAPMGVILSHVAQGQVSNTDWVSIAMVVTSWQGIAFLILEAVAGYLAVSARNQAFEIYNRLYPDKSAMV